MVSFVEIYNDKCYDLLASNKLPLEVRETKNGTFHVPNLSKHIVTEKADMFKLMKQGTGVCVFFVVVVVQLDVAVCNPYLFVIRSFLFFSCCVWFVLPFFSGLYRTHTCVLVDGSRFLTHRRVFQRPQHT